MADLNRVKKIASNFAIGKILGITPLKVGSINDTFFIETASEKYVLQKLHPIFKPGVLQDIKVITGYLVKQGILTPLLVKTKANTLGYTNNGMTWRMLSYIPGITLDSNITPKIAFEAASFIGQFHSVLSKFNYKFVQAIPHFHETLYFMEKLTQLGLTHKNSNKYMTLNQLAIEILTWYGQIDLSQVDKLPTRIIHGDLKLSNVRFDESGERAICLLDLDTLANNKVVIDIGDAARSWCNPKGEDNIEANFNIEIFESLIRGYVANFSHITRDETDQLVTGVKLLLLEQAARFLIDAYEEDYYQLNKASYQTLYDQNLTRSLSQINSYRNLEEQMDQVEEIIRSLIK